jgi:hypothetical protein
MCPQALGAMIVNSLPIEFETFLIVFIENLLVERTLSAITPAIQPINEDKSHGRLEISPF